MGSSIATSVPYDGDVGNGEAMHACGLEVHGKSLYLPLSFAANLKLLFKKMKSEKKKKSAVTEVYGQSILQAHAYWCRTRDSLRLKKMNRNDPYQKKIFI